MLGPAIMATYLAFCVPKSSSLLLFIVVSVNNILGFFQALRKT
jgi:hypothetical protein